MCTTCVFTNVADLIFIYQQATFTPFMVVVNGISVKFIYFEQSADINEPFIK